MGRKKIYHTKEELVEAHRQKQKRYYKKNKDKLNAKRMERYWKSKAESE